MEHFAHIKGCQCKKDPEAVFQAIADTLEVSTSYWNHINKMYSDVKQGDDESIDKLDQHIKNLVKKCQYTEAEKLVCRTELLFHVTKHFEVKKWVQSKKWREDVTYTALLQYTKEHEMTVKDFNCHKSNGGTAQPMMINTIKSFKHGKKGSRNGRSNEVSSLHRGSTDKHSTDKMCSKCSTIHAYRDCPAFGKKCHKCGNKNDFSSCHRSNMSQDKGHRRDRTQIRGRSPERCHWPSRGRRSRSRSWSWSSGESVTHSTHSIDRYDIGNIDIVKMFHSISSLRPVASSSNDTDPDGKTKIVTKIGIKLPHRRVVNNLQVKVDDGTEANLLPLRPFRSMFPHALDGDGYPLDGFLKDSRTWLECYNDGKLVNHGSITLKLKHYSNDSFQDHQYFIVETPTHREIIIGHPASVRLGLIKVMCKNIAEPVTAKEAKPTNLTKITNIYGKVPHRQPGSRSEHNSSSYGQKGCKIDSFQDPISRPLYRNGQRERKMSSFQDPISRPLRMYNEESLVVSDHESSEKDLTAEFETPFKTLQINGIWVSGEKDIKESHFKTRTDGTQDSREQQRQKLTPFKTPVLILDRDLVKNRGRQTHFKTMGKSGIKVSRNLTPFKTPDIKQRTSRVHFKTFDDWVLKDVSSFISEKMEEDQQRSYPSCRQPNSRQTKRNGDQTSRSSPIDRGEISMGDYYSRGEFTMEQNKSFPMLQRWEMASKGKIWSKIVTADPHPVNVSLRKRPKSPKVTEMTPFKTLSWDRGGEWLSRTLTV